MSRYWSNAVKGVEPYVPGEQPKDRKYIKLNTNENPYPPSRNVAKAIQGKADESLRLYPDPICYDLRKTIANYYNLKAEQVFVGNGSDEILAFSFLAFFNTGDTVIFPDITYSFYEVYASFFLVDYKLAPLDEEFNIVKEKFFEKNSGIVIANPNAPTGKAISLQDIKAIIEKNTGSVVIIDEAYIDFGGESAVKLIKDYSNLLVVHTLSKSRSLAGLRVGFALGHEDLIEGLNRVKNCINSYTLDRLALIGAKEAIKDETYFQEIRSKIINTRDIITQKLKYLGFKVIDSKANFIFISHQKINALWLFEKLKENNILVRYFNKPRIDNYLRVSIGSDDEMDYFYEQIKRLIENKLNH